jgi:hypothetical protein
MIDIVYSIDEENYIYDSIGEVVDALHELGDLDEGHEYWSGHKTQRKPSDYFSMSNLLEDMSCRAWDECGEYSDGFPDCAPIEQDVLEDLIDELLNQYINVDFYTVIDIKLHKITYADINS